MGRGAHPRQKGSNLVCCPGVLRAFREIDCAAPGLRWATTHSARARAWWDDELLSAKLPQLGLGLGCCRTGRHRPSAGGVDRAWALVLAVNARPETGRNAADRNGSEIVLKSARGDRHAPRLPLLLASGTERCEPLLEGVLGATGVEAEVLAPSAKDVARLGRAEHSQRARARRRREGAYTFRYWVSIPPPGSSFPGNTKGHEMSRSGGPV